MKALTVRQPHAQLIALGIKHIETRTKPTKYRGPLLIHAGAHKPLNHEHRHVDHDEVPMWIDQVDISRFWKWYEHPDNMYHGGLYCWDGPLGAIVASCKLVDCVPIVAENEDWQVQYPRPCVVSCLGDADFPDGWLEIYDPNPDSVFGRSIPEQAPYGDFTPGRFAWLLEDIKPVEQRCPVCWDRAIKSPNGKSYYADCLTCENGVCQPIPAKGNQGLWEWTP